MSRHKGNTKLEEIDYIQAYAASRDTNYMDVDECLYFQELLTNNNPEKSFLKKEMFEVLSSEAKEILGLILNSPTEFLSIFGFETIKQADKAIIKKKLSKQWDDKRYVNKLFNEISEFVRETY